MREVSCHSNIDRKLSNVTMAYIAICQSFVLHLKVLIKLKEILIEIVQIMIQ